MNRPEHDGAGLRGRHVAISGPVTHGATGVEIGHWRASRAPGRPLERPTSAFALISSAVPPGADSQDGGADSPKVTQVGLRAR